MSCGDWAFVGFAAGIVVSCIGMVFHVWRGTK